MLSILNSAIWAWIISCYGKSVKIVPERGGEKSQNDQAPNMKCQVPMTNQIPMTNDQLGFGIWSLIGHWGLVIWALVIGALPLTHPYQIPYFFLRLHKVTSSIPRTFAASSMEPVDERTARMCCSSICSRGTLSPTETPKPTAPPWDDRGVSNRCSGPTRSPRHKIDARSTTFRSSRTFPGHS